MKSKFKYYVLLVLIAVCCILGCYSFILMDKTTKAQIKFASDDVLSNEKNSSICYDIENDTIFLFWQHIIDKRNKLGGG